MQSLFSAVTLGELFKPTENREAYYETSLSQVWRKQYLFKNCMLVLNKVVLSRFLTGLLLQTLGLEILRVQLLATKMFLFCCRTEEFLTR